MTEQERKELLSQLNNLDRKERQKLLDEASRNRKLAERRTTSRPNSRSFDEDDDGAVRVRKTPPLEQFAIELLAKRKSENQAMAGRGEPVGSGIVIWTGLGLCTVEIGDTRHSCRVPTDGTSVAVGDEVAIRRVADSCFVADISPRRTVLSRPDPANSRDELVVVSNVDAVVVVVSVVAPPLHPRIVDRYLIAIQRGGADAILCVNKTDLLADLEDPREELDKLLPYQAVGIPIVHCSALDGQGIAELRSLLKGKTCAFVGHSGVGKSSTMNALCPDLGLDTGGVSEGYGRGTHTTTASSLHRLPDHTRLIDTPGIRSFGIWDVPAEELAWYFPEFARFAGGCKFRDCAHLNEPKCAVIDAVDRGDIHEERYDAYVRLREGAKD